MSAAGSQYDRFCSDVVRHQRVFTFTSSCELLVMPVGGREVVPFWSSLDRLKRTVKLHPKYAAHEMTEMSFAEFQKWLDQLSDEGILVGVNWSGAKLTGYDVSVADLRIALEHRMQRPAE